MIGVVYAVSFRTGKDRGATTNFQVYPGLAPGLDLAFDHLVSLEIAGAPADPLNLWPEPYAEPLGAHTKDKGEDAAHRFACSGKFVAG